MSDSDRSVSLGHPVFEALEPRLLLSGSVVITEFMADNVSTHPDGDGLFSDWIELHNPGGVSVDLDGWFLSDDESVRNKWSFPSVTLDSGEYLVVFASNQAVVDYVDGGGNLHTNFALNADGESVVLTRSDGVTTAHSFVDYPEQLPDVSYGLTGVAIGQETLVASDHAVTYHVPTPGDASDLPNPGVSEGWTAVAFDDSSWTSTIRLDAAGMVITEIDSGDVDFVEIQNASDAAVSTAGWSVLVNDPAGGINGVNSVEWALPASMAPGELLHRSDDPGETGAYWGSDINWTAGEDGWAMIVDAGGQVVDFAVWGYDATEIATLSFTRGPHTIDVSTQWSGDGAIVGDGTGPGIPEPEEDKLVFTSEWSWMHPLNGVDPAIADTDFNTTWTQPGGYDGPGFAATGAGVLGYGTISYSSVVTNIGKPSSGSRYSAYFRRELSLDKNLVNAGIEILCDDGTIVYVDGVEVTRHNVTGADTYKTMADDSSGTESNTYTLSIPDMTVGSHWIAVSLHQAATNSSDLGFAMRLFGQPSLPPGSALQRKGDSDGDTAGDFQATDAPDKGVQNAGLTMPFGYLIPTQLGIGFSDNQQSFDDIIVTDIEGDMEGVNASAWTRIEFQAGDVSHLGTLTLNIKYDDGFIAYLNGVEVARRNADNPLDYDTSASATRDNAQAVVFEPINISGYLDELVTGTNVLAIHGLNVLAGDADFLISAELAASNTVYDAEASWFTTPSPGVVNFAGSGFPGIVINEIHYDPDVRTELVEFIELYNGSAGPIDLSGWYFSDGVDYTFAPGTSIAAGEYLVIGQDPAQIESKFGISGVLGPYVGSLNGDGEQVVLRNAAGVRADRVEYRRGFPWPIVGDAPGNSIELVNPSIDNDLGGSWRASLSGPTPGQQNSVYASDRNTAPHMRQVNHGPNQPISGQDVTITAKITDVHGIASATLHYQLVDPGAYIAYGDSEYDTTWSDLQMVDDGTGGDVTAGDDIYTVVMPGTFQTNRRLVRYRITAADASAANLSRTGPYADDAAGNFAYYVYDGVPDWTGSDQPGVDPDVIYSSEILTSVPVYTLITKRQDHLNAQHVPYRVGQLDQELPTSGSYGGSNYQWEGTLIYDGVVYDNIHYRARGGVWRYAMGKNMWKFDFNRGHSFQARDDYGNLYDTTWDKLNFSAIIQQGNYLHRGEQGMFEAAGFKMFNLTGVEAPNTNWLHFRIVEGADENGPDQYSGDFQGLYMAIEQMDGRFLDEHDLPDGNLYKIEGGNAQLPKNNQGQTAVADRSDHTAFKNVLYGATDPDEQWWRDNVELEKYYSYRAIVEGIHHGDIAYGKNYFYYLDPETNLWSMLPWDLDLTWANNMYGNGEDPFRNQGAILSNPALDIEFENRLREIDDLLYNTDQMFALLDELTRVVDDPAGGLSILDADRAMWDYNPIMGSSYVNSGKSGYGRFYQKAPSRDFPGMVQLMKDYVSGTSRSFDTDTTDPDLPQTPTITHVGMAGFPINRLTFQSSAFGSPSGATFTAMEWRVGEVTDPTAPTYDPNAPIYYEIEDIWNSGELAVFDDQATVPPANLEVGHAYRARVRMKDSTGRWSHWSDPVQFVCGESNETELTRSLRVTEIMYNPADPPPGGDYPNGEFEFVELRNVGDQTLDISGVSFTKGITFSFAPSGVTSLGPGEFVIVAKNVTAFESRYDTSVMNLVGGYPDKLSDSGERITLSDTVDGIIQSFKYNDSWYATTDGDGFSLTVVYELADRDEWNNKSNWGVSGPVGGSPGTENGGVPPGSVIINEALAHSDGYPNDIVELHNPTNTDIDIGGWFLSDSNDTSADLMKYRIAAGTMILAGEYLLLTEDDNFGVGSVDPGSAEGFALSEFGDDIWLSSYADVEIEGIPTVVPGGYREHVDFGASPNGVTIGLYVKTTGGTDFTLLSAATFGPLQADHINASPFMDDVVINEIMYHPPVPTPDEILAGFASPDDFEFIELYNRGAAAVDLTQYYLSPGVGFSFGWYNADDFGDETWTLQAGSTAQWQAALDPGEYQVYARWNINDGELNSRSLDSAASYDIAHAGGSDLVILDQNVNPAPDGWVLLNTYNFDGASTVELTRGTNDPSQWTIADQIKFVSTSGGQTVTVDNDSGDFTTSTCDVTSLAPGQYVLLVSNEAAFQERYGILNVAGAYSGLLANDGEKVKLLKAGAPEATSGYMPYYRADYVNYGDNLPWPAEADGLGASLSRMSVDAYGNDPGNWATGAARGTPGVENIYLDTTPPTIPTNLTSANVNGIRIDLDWDDSSDLQSHVDHYVVYRDGGQIDTTATSDYSDSNVEPTAPYSYRVSSVNRDGYESELSGQEFIVIPGIVLIETISANELRITFSEPVEAVSAQDEANYVLDSATILSAVLAPDNVTVTLGTSELQSAQSYLLTVNNVDTLFGGVMPADLQESFTFHLEGSGTILREWWTGIGGNEISLLTGNANYPDNPTGSEELTIFEGPTQFADSYGTRMRGYVHPPTTGNYVFWIATDDNGELWLSTDDDPANKQLIASVSGWAGVRDWYKFASQESTEIHLVAGQRYYVEALQKEGNGGDNMAVAWRLPDATFEAPIPGNRLSPWSNNTPPYVLGSIDDVNVDQDAPDSVLNLSGAFGDADPGDSLGLSVTGNTNTNLVTAGIVGTQLTLSYAPGAFGAADITIRATDTGWAWVEDTFTVTVDQLVQVAGRHVFYNNSAWDIGGDDGAIAPDKTVVLPGGIVSPANYSNFTGGINGIMVDISALPGTPGPSDFSVRMNEASTPDSWSAGPAPSVSVRSGEGVGGSDRVTLTWADGAIVNRWVEVTVLATANTGLGTGDVFYFGNAVGETGGDGTIDDNDYTALKGQFGQRGGIGTLGADFNADGRVGLRDFAIMRAGFGDTVLAPTIPAPAPQSPQAAMAPAPETESELGSPAPTASTDSALAIQTSDTSILSWASVEVGRIALPAEPDQPSEEPVIELELSDALLDNNPDDGLEDSLDTDGVLVDILAESALVIPL
ncbi:MAG: lamin tail domain-containing protein [Phycisphaerae bacterium]|nr:lamin tail domain-containing protein [Phycisphaerae bacterium]